MTTIAARPAVPPTQAFGWLAVGIVMSQVDLRLNGFDLLPDMLGYLIVALAAARLRSADRWFTAAAVAALALPVGIGAGCSSRS